METEHSGDLAHHQALEILPWYVNGRLEPAESHRVETHLSACEICQREADGLATMLSIRAASIPERPVNEARLAALFTRIDGYEATRRQNSRREPRGQLLSWHELRDRFMNWWTVQPALVAGTFAAVVLAAILVPVLRSPQPVPAAYEVLGPAADTLRVRIRFQTAPTQQAIKQLVEASRADKKLGGAYSIERRTDTEYVVVFVEKPGIQVVSRVINDWRGAPNVAEVSIDDGVTGN